MLKTHSGIKKRFKVTGSGKLKISQSGKRHGLRRRSARSLNEHTGYTYAHSGDIRRLLRGMPGQKISRITNYRLNPANKIRVFDQICTTSCVNSSVETVVAPVTTKSANTTEKKVVQKEAGIVEKTKTEKKAKDAKESSKTSTKKTNG